MDYQRCRRREGGQDLETLVMDDQSHVTWMTSAGNRIALTVIFIGVALLAAGIVMYFA
jgi:hypothetical protein